MYVKKTNLIQIIQKFYFKKCRHIQNLYVSSTYVYL